MFTWRYHQNDCDFKACFSVKLCYYITNICVYELFTASFLVTHTKGFLTNKNSLESDIHLIFSIKSKSMCIENSLILYSFTKRFISWIILISIIARFANAWNPEAQYGCFIYFYFRFSMFLNAPYPLRKALSHSFFVFRQKRTGENTHIPLIKMGEVAATAAAATWQIWCRIQDNITHFQFHFLLHKRE